MFLKMKKVISTIVLTAFIFSMYTINIMPIKAYAQSSIITSVYESEEINETEFESEESQGNLGIQPSDGSDISKEEFIEVTESQGNMQIQATPYWQSTIKIVGVAFTTWVLVSGFDWLFNNSNPEGNVIEKVLKWLEYTKINGRMIDMDKGSVGRGSSRTADIKAIQTRLKQLGYYNMTVDGQFGAGTESAVKAFQTKHALSSDGIVGRATFTQLGWCNTSSSGGAHAHIR